MGANLSLRDLLRSSTLPQSDTRLLLAHVLDKHYQLPRSALLSRDDMELSPIALADWKLLETKRLNGEPIAYLVGKKGFHNIELQVAPGVLIPRPETELLVEIGLLEISRLGGKAQILDLGTGSGAIALAIASAAPDSQVVATDQAPEALAIARSNAQYLKLERQVQFVQGSWYEAIEREATFDLILSNPPYIEKGDPHLQQGDLRFEPIHALTDQANGLSCLAAIISKAKLHLNPKGLIAVEHGFDQSDAVVALMKSAGLEDIQTHLDLAGHRRVASGRK
ncbi:peptide chain release factor N(5)-glutamine methyltransferase [Polynucleobacter sp. 15G-AUS-farblos]|uniref:peptide chain release factor N(5)-glutamine methyltransferase n=1 Tax=Polynucleobacter sp. 15G-AUS-farblos TaxID=2689094 RepID=UPI001C0BCC15|nr:peptide chain release factor N(5)-glutamine methyltransferase [Polynucleobacter sp. 15G-AUS-farblos]MBU3583914.1 peptide chain release factor N(5)-glutamine methyltransferase [Polynucleobacter sp. 15G-AUS-farblos]